MGKNHTETGCRHGTSTMVRALSQFARAYRLAQQGDVARHHTMSEAYAVCPEICDEVAAGRHDGSVPMPGTAQWEDYLDRRTGTTRAWRDALLQPAQGKRRDRPDKHKSSPKNGVPSRRKARQKQIPKQQTSGTGHPLRQTVVGPYSHEHLAQRWAAVRGEVSTTVLATLLGVPDNDVKSYARMLGDMLEEHPWRLRVRRGTVDGDILRERCDDILTKIEDDDLF